MSNYLDKLLVNWSSITYSDLAVLFIIVSCTWFYYTNIYTVFYTGKLSHIPHHRNPLYHIYFYYYLKFFGDVTEYSKLHKTYGKVILIDKNSVLISDIKAYKFLNGYKFKKGKIYSTFDFRNSNIFSTRDKEFHSKRKRLLSPAFNVKSMQAMESIILEIGTLNLVNYLTNEMELLDSSELRVNILELLYRSTFDVIGKLVFGESRNFVNNPKEFRYIMKLIFRTQLALGLIVMVPFVKKYFLPTDIVGRVIGQIINKRRLEKSQHWDILQSMIDTQKGLGLKLRDDEIIDEALVLLFAGIDTTANTLIFTIYEILRNKDLYARIVDEILVEFPDPNAIITAEGCRKRLPLLEATLFESLRFLPVAFGPIPRIVPCEGATIDGHFIPEGTEIMFNTFAVHRSEENFPNPNEFNIDKWLGPDKEEYKSKLYAFSTGPRACIGKELAWMEMLLILSHLLHRFDIKMDSKTNITPTNGFLLTPKEKYIYATFKKRIF